MPDEISLRLRDQRASPHHQMVDQFQQPQRLPCHHSLLHGTLHCSIYWRLFKEPQAGNQQLGLDSMKLSCMYWYFNNVPKYLSDWAYNLNTSTMLFATSHYTRGMVVFFSHSNLMYLLIFIIIWAKQDYVTYAIKYCSEMTCSCKNNYALPPMSPEFPHGISLFYFIEYESRSWSSCLRGFTGGLTGNEDAHNWLLSDDHRDITTQGHLRLHHSTTHQAASMPTR